MKLGKQPARPRDTDIRWAALSASIALPTLPSRFGHGTLYKDWGMLGNDQYGDCVWAGAAHEHMLISKVVHQVDLPFTDKAVLSDYSAVTGFDPDDPSTDNGTYVDEALSYRRKTGIVDAAGHRHQIGAYVALDPTNWNHLREATYIFGATGIGFEFPSFAFDQFDKGQPWDFKPGESFDIEGGHYVCVVGEPREDRVAVLSWKKRQVMTRAFYEEFNDEAWVYIAPEILHSDGKGLHGFDLATLNSYLGQLKK